MNRCIITITTPEPQSDADITIEFDPPPNVDRNPCTTVEVLAVRFLEALGPDACRSLTKPPSFQ